MLILPTALSVRQEIRRRLERSSEGAVPLEGIMSISAFEQKLMEELAPVNTISPVGRSLLIRETLLDYKESRKDGAFAHMAQKQGLVRALARWFDELKQALVKPEEFKKAADLDDDRIHDLHHLYERYQALLESAGLADEGDRRIRLIELLNREGPSSTFLKRIGSLELRGITNFSPFRFQLLVSLAREIPVRIVFPASGDFKDELGVINRNYQKFKSLEGKLERMEVSFEDGWIPERERLRRQAEGIQVIEAPSKYREIEEIGHRVVSLIEEGIQPERIAVVWRDLSSVGSLVEDIFRRYRIPFLLQSTTPLSSFPLAGIIMSLLQVPESGYEREAVLQVLKDKHVQGALGLEVNQDLIERALLDANIMEGPSGYWRQRLEDLAAEAERDDKRRPELESLKRIAHAIPSLIEKIERISRCERLSELADHLCGFLSELPLPRMLESDHNPWIIRRQLLSIHGLLGLFAAVKKEAKLVGRGGGMQYQEMVCHITEAIRMTRVSAALEHEQNAVRIIGAQECAGLSFDHVFIGGMEEGSFPIGPQIDALWPDEHRLRFNRTYCEMMLPDSAFLHAGRRPFLTALERWEEEALLFYSALGSSRGGLTLSFSRTDRDGRPLARSSFIRQLEESLQSELPVEKAPFLQVERDYRYCHEPGEFRNKLALGLFEKKNLDTEEHNRIVAVYEALRQSEQIIPSFSEWLSRAEIEIAREIFFSPEDPLERNSRAGPFTGLIKGHEPLLRKEDGSLELSPAALEDYGRCPFRFFAAKLLGLEELRRPEPDTEAKLIGKLVHEILEKFYTQPLADPSGSSARIKEVAMEIFKRWEAGSFLGEKNLWAIRKEELLDRLTSFIQKDKEECEESGFVPTAFELRFGMGASDGEAFLPPLELTLIDGERVRFTGVIDRIDTHRREKRLRIIEYKYSKKDRKEYLKPENMGIKSFQLPVYVLAVRNLWKKEQMTDSSLPIRAGFYLLKEPRLQSADYTDLQNFTENLTITLRRIIEGDFQVTPSEQSECKRCPYRRICRIPW